MVAATLWVAAMARQSEITSQDVTQKLALAADFDCLVGVTTPAPQAPKVARSAAAEPLLGNTAKSVGRSKRFRWQRHAAKLLRGKGRVGLCRWSVISKSLGVDLVESRYNHTGDKGLHFEGVQTCGSVWACPCCSARISETRRGELNQLLVWAREQGLTVSMVTLTARHGRDDDLADLLDRMKRAKQRWAQHRAYKRLKPQMVGSVTATEVTAGGANGWHPHFHVIVVTEPGTDLSLLRDAWLASLQGAGLDGAGAAFQVQDASAAGRYVTKWGAAEEVTLGARKLARGGGGRTPAQLLAASCDDDDKRAGVLWSEYAEVFHGRRQLVWSRGLKTMAGIGEVSDDDAAKDEKQDDQEETDRANIGYAIWKHSVAARHRDRRAAVLDRAEEIGAEAAVAELVAGRMPDADMAELVEDAAEARRDAEVQAETAATIKWVEEILGAIETGRELPRSPTLSEMAAAAVTLRTSA